MQRTAVIMTAPSVAFAAIMSLSLMMIARDSIGVTAGVIVSGVFFAAVVLIGYFVETRRS